MGSLVAVPSMSKNVLGFSSADLFSMLSVAGLSAAFVSPTLFVCPPDSIP